MIQRIQTVYLLLVAILMIVAMALPVGSFYTVTEVFGMTNLYYTLPDGTMNYSSCVLFILLAVAAVVSIITIFLYRKRKRQIRLTVMNSIVLVAYYLAAIYFILSAEGQDDSGFVPSWSLCLPLISIILNWLAIRAIDKDEMLVKSYDRIR